MRKVARYIANSVFALSCVILLAAASHAQSTLTRLEGAVQDASGRPAPGATITAEENSTGLRSEAVTDDEGHYLFPGLRPGTYTISVKATGFKQKVRKQVNLLLPGTTGESFTLHPGDANAIESEAAANARLGLSDSRMAQTFSRADLDALPLLTRNPLSLALYQSGVQLAVGNEGASSVNGNRAGSANVAMDGLGTGDSVNPSLDLSLVAANTDSVQELRLVTAGAQAEYGRAAGNQAMLISRSGAKNWSGTLFDYFRNKQLNANDFFNNASKTPNPTFTQNNFGGVLSGPIAAETFLFLDFEGRRIERQVTQNSQVLTPTAKTGVFQWYTPGTSTLQTYNMVANDPRKLGIDRRVAASLAQTPDTNNSLIGDGLNIGGFLFNNPVYSHSAQGTVRLDGGLGAGRRWFLRLNWDRIDATDVAHNAQSPYPGTPTGLQKGRDWGATAGLNWNLGPKAINEFRIGYLRSVTDLNRDARSSSPMLLANSWTNPLNPSFSSSYSTPALEASNYFTLARKSHQIRFGGTFRHSSQNSVDTKGIYPNVTFGRNFGNLPPAAVGPSGNAVISPADRVNFENIYNDLLGRIESVTQTFNSNLSAFLPAGSPSRRSFSSREYAAFVQDDWHIRPNFMLNLGLRYEFSGAPSERDGLQAALDQGAQVSAAAKIAGFSFLPGQAWFTGQKTNFAPHAGFAWNFTKRKMVLRGGWGITYDRIAGATTNFVDQNTTPLSQSIPLYPNLARTDIRLSDGIPLPAPPAAPILKLPATRSSSIAILDPGLSTPYVHQIHLGLQKQLFAGTVIEASYVGGRGKKLFMNLNLNQTKIEGDFLQAFLQIRAYRASGTPVPASNTLVRLFGSTNGAISAIGGSIFDSGQVGVAADTVDRNNFTRYAAAGVSDFYLRNFTQFSDFVEGTNAGHSSYDSLQVTLRRSRPSYMVNAHYTWSKSFDNSSSNGTAYVAPLDSFNPSANKGLSDFDRRHSLNIAARYSLPLGKNQTWGQDMSGVMDAIVGGWNLGALGVWQTGAPFSISSGLQTAQAGVATLVDNSGSSAIGDVIRAPNGVFYFNSSQIAAFSTPAPGGRGTSGRNAFVGPSYLNLDLSLFKRFKWRENRHFVFRGEVFNVLNRAQFGLPGANMADPGSFGRITSTQGNARIIQLALKFEF
jgi:hypothetical protein